MRDQGESCAPAAPSHAHAAKNTSLYIAKQAEKQKTKKYQELLNYNANTDFVPFACETFGGIGNFGRELIKDIGTTARDYSYEWLPEDIQIALPCAIAVTIQKCNAMAAMRCRTALASKGRNFCPAA